MGAERGWQAWPLHQAAARLLNLARAADEEGLVRIAAMESLGLLGDRAALAPLCELAASPDPQLAFAARSALARIAGTIAESEVEPGDGILSEGHGMRPRPWQRAMQTTLDPRPEKTVSAAPTQKLAAVSSLAGAGMAWQTHSPAPLTHPIL